MLSSVLTFGYKKIPPVRKAPRVCYAYFWKYTLSGSEFSTSPILNENL